MNGITEIADSINSELKRRLPKQRKTQRTKLALLVATMLDVRSANLMDLAAGLPREADRTDMRYQWIVRGSSGCWAIPWWSATRSWSRSRARCWSGPAL